MSALLTLLKDAQALSCGFSFTKYAQDANARYCDNIFL
jgi:hypothetical protein